MKTANFFPKLLKLLFSLTLLLPLTSLAKETSLYEQPKTDAKIVGTVDLSTGIIPIYTPKGSEWIKVADPRNGNVGWIKSSELNNAGTSQTTFTFTQSSDNKSPTTYKIIQFGQPANLTPEQSEALAKKMQTQQQEFQKSMQNMINNMNQLFYNDSNFMRELNFPVFMPVVILPVEKTTNTTHQPNANKSAVDKTDITKAKNK